MAEKRMQVREHLNTGRAHAALPRWIISGKSRYDVVRCLRKLREKLEATRLA